jgi:nitrate/nitrite transporter NarK
MAALRSRDIWVMILVYFCVIAGNATLVYYGPSIVREVGFKDIKTLGWIMSGVYVCGWLGMMINGHLSDRAREIRWHAAIAAAIGAGGLLLAALFVAAKNAAGVIVSLALSAAGTMGAIPVFWQNPPRFLSGSAVAVGLAVINSIANLAGYFAPQLLGYLKTTTGQYGQGMTIVAAVEFLAVVMVLLFISKDRLAGKHQR